MRAAVVIAGCLAVSAHPARAQETQSEEAQKRKELLRTLPDNAAKRLFGDVSRPAPLATHSIGSYARGCLAGAKGITVDGDVWQVMRLSRNRRWGHPDLIAMIERIAHKARREINWNGLLIGDISQPRGGPMLTGHASHQVGLDADLWLMPMPQLRLSEAERETIPARNMVKADWATIDRANWSEKQFELIKLAAEEPRVERIFVNPVIKKELCEEAGDDREWLKKVRPLWGHNYHFHVRITCPAGEGACAPQEPPPDSDGCGKEVKNWLTLQHNAYFGPKRPGSSKPPRPWTLDDLPDACREVLAAP